MIKIPILRQGKENLPTAASCGRGGSKVIDCFAQGKKGPSFSNLVSKKRNVPSECETKKGEDTQRTRKLGKSRMGKGRNGRRWGIGDTNYLIRGPETKRRGCLLRGQKQEGGATGKAHEAD